MSSQSDRKNVFTALKTDNIRYYTYYNQAGASDGSSAFLPPHKADQPPLSDSTGKFRFSGQILIMPPDGARSLAWI